MEIITFGIYSSQNVQLGNFLPNTVDVTGKPSYGKYGIDVFDYMKTPVLKRIAFMRWH